MGSFPITVHVRTWFDGRVFVPEEPLDMPVGTTLDGLAKSPLSQEAWHALLDRVQGAWGEDDFVEPEELPYDKEEPID